MGAHGSANPPLVPIKADLSAAQRPVGADPIATARPTRWRGTRRARREPQAAGA